MGETLIQRRRVLEEALRGVKSFSTRKSRISLLFVTLDLATKYEFFTKLRNFRISVRFSYFVALKVISSKEVRLIVW